MRIDVEIRQSHPLVTLAGRFDAHAIAEFRDRIEPLLAAGTDVDIDLSQVVFMDSSALAELLTMTRRVRDGGRDLVLRDPSHPVRVIFELTALDAAFTIQQTPGSAAPSVGPGAWS